MAKPAGRFESCCGGLCGAEAFESCCEDARQAVLCGEGRREQGNEAACAQVPTVPDASLVCAWIRANPKQTKRTVWTAVQAEKLDSDVKSQLNI